MIPWNKNLENIASNISFKRMSSAIWYVDLQSVDLVLQLLLSRLPVSCLGVGNWLLLLQAEDTLPWGQGVMPGHRQRQIHVVKSRSA